MTDATQGSPTAWPRASIAWYGTAVLFLGYLAAFMDRSILTLLVVPIEKDLGLNNVQLGVLQGLAFVTFYVLMGLPLAFAIDRINRRNVVAAGIGFWSVMTCFSGLARSFNGFFLARVGVGAGEGTILPGATSLVADYFPPAKRGRALGLFASGIYLGNSLSLIGAGVLLGHLQGRITHLGFFGDLKPWQMVLLVAGLTGLPVALAALFMREPPRRHGRAKSLGPAPGTGLKEAFTQNPGAIGAQIVGFTMMAFAAYAGTSWLATIFIRDLHLTQLATGLRLGVMSLVLGPLGSILGGLLADKLESAGQRSGKFTTGLVAAIGVVPGALLFAGSPSLARAMVGAGLLIFFSSSVWGVAVGALQEIVHGAVLGRVTAIYTGILNIFALGLGPLSVALVGRWISGGNGGLSPGMAIVVPLAALVAAIAFIAGRRPYLKARDQLDSLIPINRAN